MQNQHVISLKVLFEANRIEDNAVQMEKYMRGKFSFIGLKAKERRDISKTFMKDVDFHQEDVESIIRTLWEMPEREYQYVAVDYLVKNKKCLTDSHLELLEYLITTKSWWDTIDAIASHLVGIVFQKNPHLIIDWGEKWLDSGNIWLQRTMLLFQLKYKEKTDEALLVSIILRLKDIDEFFIQKAIGWSLREYSKTNPEFVSTYIKKQELSNLAIREGSKYIKDIRWARS